MLRDRAYWAVGAAIESPAGPITDIEAMAYLLRYTQDYLEAFQEADGPRMSKIASASKELLSARIDAARFTRVQTEDCQ